MLKDMEEKVIEKNELFESVVVTYDDTPIYGLWLEFSNGWRGWADFDNNNLSDVRKNYSEKLIESYLGEVIVNSHYNTSCKYKVFKKEDVVRSGGYLFSSKID